MTLADWKRVQNLFDDALGQPEAERAAWVEAQGESPSVRQEALSLLDALRQQDELNLSEERFADSAPAPERALPYDRFGVYRLIGLLGRGGTSTVYRAERTDGLFDRKVALKVLAANLGGEGFLRRFRNEGKLLPNLRHPNVATLLDGGLSDGGHPYLVLDLVEGKRMDQYCDEHKLPIADRLRLFRQVCEAVEFAHDKGVLHRDLKPSNILVTTDGIVKLLDFGTGALIANDPGNTASTHAMLTPRYASPEQLNGKRPGVTGDVFSLGVILYELLSGAWPYGDAGSVLSELKRAAGKGSPIPLTEAVTSQAAESRSSAAGPLKKELRGRLSRIVGRALEFDAGRRYPSVRELAGDLDQYLAGEAVEAGGSIRLPVALRERTWQRLFAGLLALVSCGAWLFSRAQLPVRNHVGIPPALSIAVLPFANASANTASNYFSEGLTREITDSLARMKALRVIGRSSVASFAGQNVDLGEVGRKLNVANVLEGSAEQAEGKVKVIARLKRTSDGAVLWSNTYVRAAGDLFALQSDLVSGVATNLLGASRVTALLAKHAPNAQAQELLFKGIYELNQLTPTTLNRAETDFREAIELDPAYAAAYVDLCSVFLDRSVSVTMGAPPRETMEPLLRKALELDPDTPGAHSLLGLLAMQFDWDWARAEREFQLATASSSNSDAETQYALLLTFLGRFDEADRHATRALELSPVGTSTLFNAGLLRNLEGRFDQSCELFERIRNQFPAMPLPRLMIAAVYIEEGRPELALPIAQGVKTQLPAAALSEAVALAGMGKRGEALRLMRPYEEKYPNSGVPLQGLAVAYTMMGDEPNAIKWLERSADRHEYQALNIAVHPVYATIRNSPGFLALKKRMGLEGVSPHP